MRHPECFKAASHGIQPGRRDPLLPFESTPTTTARQRERSPAVERGIDADGQFVPFATGGLKAS